MVIQPPYILVFTLFPWLPANPPTPCFLLWKALATLFLIPLLLYTLSWPCSLWYTLMPLCSGASPCCVLIRHPLCRLDLLLCWVNTFLIPCLALLSLGLYTKLLREKNLVSSWHTLCVIWTQTFPYHTWQTLRASQEEEPCVILTHTLCGLDNKHFHMFIPPLLPLLAYSIVYTPSLASHHLLSSHHLCLHTIFVLHHLCPTPPWLHHLSLCISH